MKELQNLFKAASLCQTVSIENWSVVKKEEFDLSWVKYSSIKSLLLEVLYYGQEVFLYKWFFKIVKGISKSSAMVKQLKEILADGNIITSELIENRLYKFNLTGIKSIIKFVY